MFPDDSSGREQSLNKDKFYFVWLETHALNHWRHPLLGVTVGFFYFCEIHLKEDLWKSGINSLQFHFEGYADYATFGLICKGIWYYAIW